MIIKKGISLSLLSVILFSATGCSVETEDIPGVYSVQYEWGNEVIKIFSDNTYEQSVDILENDSVKNSGTWKHNVSRNEILLYDYIPVSNPIGRFNQDYLKQGPIRGLYLLRRKGGETILRFHPDISLSFKRVKDED